jgi:hypothetical protein
MTNEFDTIHLRHVQIANNNVKSLLRIYQPIQASGTVIGDCNFIETQITQDFDSQLGIERIIIDQQYGHGIDSLIHYVVLNMAGDESLAFPIITPQGLIP